MTRRASHGRFVLLVTIDAPLHLQRLLENNAFLRGDASMAVRTLNLGCRMGTVAEKYEFG